MTRAGTKTCKFCETGSEWDALAPTAFSLRRVSSCYPFHNSKIICPKVIQRKTVSLPFTCDLAEFVFSCFCKSNCFLSLFTMHLNSGPAQLSKTCCWMRLGSAYFYPKNKLTSLCCFPVERSMPKDRKDWHGRHGCRFCVQHRVTPGRVGFRRNQEILI